jgi:hypothetical protein
MYNVKFTLSNGKEVYPNYMNTNQRSVLKDQLGNKSEVMWCSCRTEKKLYYRLSENLRFYPEHNGYEHSPYCIRYHTKEEKRLSAIVRSDEETATIYLHFNPKNFTIPTTSQDDESNNDIEDNILDNNKTPTISNFANENADENELIHINKIKVDTQIYKEPKFNLPSFIRCINYDTFTERAINNKPILTSDYFTASIFGRLKNLRISGMKKSVRSLTLEDDGFRFFYSSFAGCEIKKSANYTSYNLLVTGNDKTTYSLFTFGSIYEKALKKFNGQYGIEPNEHTMVAGFQYYPQSKGKTNHYKVVGRMHLFQISEQGLYCNSLYEQSCYNRIIDFVKNYRNEKIRFYIPADDDSITGIIEIEGYSKKGIILIPTSKESKTYSVDNNLYIPLILDPDIIINNTNLDNLIRTIKSNC